MSVHYDIKHEESGWVRGPYKDYVSALNAAGALSKEKGGTPVTIEKVTVTTVVELVETVQGRAA